MALPTKLTLSIVTPDLLIAHEVDEVSLPGQEGDFGVLPGHTPLFAGLRTGPMWYRQGATKHLLAVSIGFAEVLPDRVTILAQLAERAEDIDVARAEAARTRATERLDQQSEIDYERARLALMKSMTRLQVSSRIASGAGARLKRVQREGV